MGCMQSSNGTKSAYVTKAPKSEYDLRITAGLKKYQNTLTTGTIPKSERVKSFNQVLTRSHRIRKSLVHIKSVFARFDVDKSNSIDHGELTEALKILGNDVCAEDVEKVFHEADIYDNNKLSQKEFIICLVLGYVLGHLKLSNATVKEPTKEAEVPMEEAGEDGYEGHAQELKWAFAQIIGTYLLFDEDASGDLSRDEVMNQLHNKTGVFADKGAQQMMSEERWKELDWDGDGTITFREFAWAFQSWISLDAEDED